jgi:L-xylulokinase
MKKYVIAIDRGSTNVKAVVFDTEGNEIFTSSCPSQKPVSIKPGWWEQDMQIIWENTASAIKGVFAGPILPEEIMGVFVAGQGNGMMPIDKNGNPSRMGILSLDSRAADIHNGWIADGRYSQAIEKLVFPFVVGSPMCLLAWFKQNAPEEYSRIGKILFSKDWIRYKLSGTICTDPSDASGAGMMDPRRGEYAHDVFDLLGIADINEKLPEIRPSHDIVGSVTKEAALATGLKEGTPVLCGAHDIAAYPFGIGSMDSKELVTVVGTWGFSLIPVTSLDGMFMAYYHTVPGYFMTGVGDGNSGGCLDIIINTMCEYEKHQAAQKGISVYEYIENMIENTRTTGILFHPFIFGNIFFGSSSGCFYGIKNWHTKADIMRAVYEGIVMGYHSNMKLIPGSDKCETMWLIGGGAKSRIFGQIFADVTGLPVKVPKSYEITARGAAMNALVGLGIYKNHQEACIPPEIRTVYQPDPETQAYYQKKSAAYQQIFDVNMQIWDTLSRLNP